MRLSAQIIQSAEQRTNPLGEREIILRSLAIPAIEHLAVSRDQFDTMDLSNNHLQRIDNFPKLERLSTLYLGGNEINYVDSRNLKKNLPNLTTIILTGNGVKGWNVIADLGDGCPKLEFLSLAGNPVTNFQKVKQSERERANRLASSAAGAAMEADARLEARVAAAAAPDDSVTASKAFTGEDGVNTFEPGEGKNAEESFATQFTMEEKAKIREMVANAASADEIDRIESLVKKGIFPGEAGNSGGALSPPPPPPPEDEDNGNSKRQKIE